MLILKKLQNFQKTTNFVEKVVEKKKAKKSISTPKTAKICENGF